MDASPVHYESQYYGPFTAFFVKIFDPNERFLVKAQPRLRTAIQTANQRASLDSNGQTVATNADDSVPDYVVARGTESLHADVPFLIIEVKNSHINHSDAAVQVDHYDQWSRVYLEHAYAQRREPVHIALVQLFGTKAWVSLIVKDDEGAALSHMTGLQDLDIQSPIMRDWFEHLRLLHRTVSFPTVHSTMVEVLC